MDRYIFRLERMKGVSEFSLEDLVVPSAERPKSVYETVHRHVRSPFAINGKPILQMFRDSGFELISAEYVNLESRNLVHVKYDYNSTDDEMLRGGEWWLDPSRSWCIVKSRSKFYVADKPGVDAGMECAVTYSDSVDGMPVPSSVTIETYLGRYHATESLTNWSVEKSSPGDFTLAHYGLEEQSPRSRPREGLTLSFGSVLLMAVTVGLLGFFFAKRLQQMSRRNS